MAALALPQRPLTDGVVALRPRRDADTDAMAAMGRDPEIVRWTPVPSDYDAAQARVHAAQVEREWRAGGPLFLVIADAATDVLLGSCDVRLPGDDPRVGEIGYLLVPGARGRGHATRAVRLLSAYATAALGMTRIQALTDPANAPSRRVLERAGFSAEGLLRDHRGPGQDRVLYALTASSPGP